MFFSMTTLYVALATIPFVLGTPYPHVNYDVQVGAGGNVYTPDVLWGLHPGDTVKFYFNPKNHSVTESTLDKPCAPKEHGFTSGFRPVTAEVGAEPFVYTVESYDPVWIYCGQGNHCEDGMVFAINPTDHWQLDTFKQNALNSPRDPPPPPQPAEWHAPPPKEHTVWVGEWDQLTFNPPYVYADVHDEIVFKFAAKNHTITRSSFDEPCTSSWGFDSGFMPVINGVQPEFRLTVEEAGPIWAYCKQPNGNHCQKGMVFAINPPSEGDHTFDKFLEKAWNAPIVPPPTWW